MATQQLKPKPIFVMRIPMNISSSESQQIRDAIYKDSISDEYHVLIIPAHVDEYEFEMYNADNIEVQRWNELVNRILK